MEQPELTVYREAWLQAAAAFLMDYLVERGLPRVQVRVSCGWPLRGGVARRRTVIGQCFPPTASKDGKPQIFISPLLSESIDVLGVLLHELIHACFGCQFGHGKQFSQAARRVGLAGPPTATTVGDVLRLVLVSYVEQVGPYPHAAILVKPKDKIGSRLRLYQCGCEPPVKVRVASDHFQARCLVCDSLFEQV
ncbi:MAG TPA: SprT-like domain-containing protein [Ktedonobacteraceae bacterium]|nr:SprT-like domain-containing protein [Ktedonobacteraceae bacterium]